MPCCVARWRVGLSHLWRGKGGEGVGTRTADVYSDHIMLMWGFTWKCFPKTKRSELNYNAYIWINFQLFIYLFIYLSACCLLLRFAAIHAVLLASLFCNALRCDAIFRIWQFDWLEKDFRFHKQQQLLLTFCCCTSFSCYCCCCCQSVSCRRGAWPMGRVGGRQ